jgi:ketosteroid isomerase-like protein
MLRVVDAEKNLRRTYRAFNDQDIEVVIEQLHPDVDWPNAWEGGRVIGRDAVREYWTRQFKEISGRVEPESFTQEPDGAVTVEVHQVVHDAKSGDLLTDTQVLHRYWLDDAGLVTRMEVL